MMNQATAAVAIIGSAVACGSAMAQTDIKIGIGIPFSPGQTGTSPGQAFNAARKLDPAAPSAGQFYILNRNNDPTTVIPPAHPPGQTVTNYGRSKK